MLCLCIHSVPLTLCCEQDVMFYTLIYSLITTSRKKPERSKKTDTAKQNWRHLIVMNVSKSNYICNDKNEIPDETDNQKKIFDNQLSKYVETEDCKVAILNAFPIFLFDYFGKKVLEEANIENSKKQQI